MPSITLDKLKLKEEEFLNFDWQKFWSSINFVTWYTSKNEPFRAIVAGASIILFALFVFFASVWHIQGMARNALKPYEESRTMISRYVDTVVKPDSLDAKYFPVFKAQQRLLNIRTSHYKELSIIFFRNYYANLVLTIIFSCLGGLLLFILVSRGWSYATMPMKSAFLTISVVLSFSGLFPLVFRQEENFKENIKYYMDYQQAQVNIMGQFSYFNNRDTLNWSHVADSMISANNVRINQLTNYVLNIDAKELKSVSDIYRVLESSTKGSKDSLLLKP